MAFLAKNRKDLLDGNQTGKYLKYAIGEILLVVVGILIAVQINNWKTFSKSRAYEKQYLHNLIDDLEYKSQVHSSAILERFEDKVDGLMLAKEYAYGNYVVNDTLDFINQVTFGGVFSRFNLNAVNSTIKELISTGDLKLIQNTALKDEILAYYSNLNTLDRFIDNIRTDFASQTNALNAFDPKNPNDKDPRDFVRTLQKFRKEEFLNLVNQELTFAYSVKSKIEDLNAQSKILIGKIEAELKVLEK